MGLGRWLDITQQLFYLLITSSHLLIPDIVGRGGGGPLHGHQTHHLQEVVLHHIPNDAEVVEVAAAALRQPTKIRKKKNLFVNENYAFRMKII